MSEGKERLLSPEEAFFFWEAVYEALWNMVSLVVAVFCCLCLVTLAIYGSPDDPNASQTQLPYTPLSETGVSSEQRTVNSFGNAFILLGTIIAMTCVMVCLFYFGCYAVIGLWIMIGSCFILFSAAITFFANLFVQLNVAIDYITVAFITWNFVAVGVIIVHRHGPKLLQQGYLIVESAFMALLLLAYVPPQTLWVVLHIIPVWDLIAVLTVVGPLRILVETAKKRKKGLQPGLVFATVVFGSLINMASRRQSIPSDAGRADETDFDETPPIFGEQLDEMQVEPMVPSTARGRRARHAPSPATSLGSQEEPGEESEGIKIGLGDFVFYSVLVGKMALGSDVLLAIAVGVAVLVGMCVTLLILAVVQSALPALPISLGLGLVFAHFSRHIEYFYDSLLSEQVYI
ncbi:presenilin homolog [Ornithodoros turicata]|uniref:presenilin homolog n=1 Tax=Ornithodoros turicata TaxID=34597 RepID=UPI0031387315